MTDTFNCNESNLPGTVEAKPATKLTEKGAQSIAGNMAVMRMDIENIARETVDCAFQIHRELGPGLLESIYELVLARLLEQRGLKAERQKAVSFSYAGLHFPNLLKIDVLVEDQLILELKSVEHTHPVHSKQVLSYLRLTGLPLGLLINFGTPQFGGCVRRIVNNHHCVMSSRLRIHRPTGN